MLSNTVLYIEKDIMPAKLIVFGKKGRINTWDIGEHCIIGRKCEGSKATVQLESGLVSRIKASRQMKKLQKVTLLYCRFQPVWRE